MHCPELVIRTDQPRRDQRSEDRLDEFNATDDWDPVNALGLASSA